jgi:ABC-2 type transport system permease protein
MKQLFTILRQDVAIATRDVIVLYILLAPLIIAVVLRLVIPSVEGTRLSFALLDDPGGAEMREALEGYGRVEVHGSPQSLEMRVRRADDTAGIVVGPGGVELVVEGNEDPGLVLAWQAVAAAMTQPPGESVVFEDLGGEPSYLRPYALVFLLISVPLLAAMAAGFNFVEDQESEMSRALAASPLTLRMYLGARTLFVTLAGAVLSILAAVVFTSQGLPVFRLTLTLVAIGPVAAVFAFIVALTARTQIAALGSVKLLFPLYTLPPILGAVLPGNWQWPLFVFPNYWAFATLRSLLVDRPFPVPFWLCLGLLAATGAAACLGVGATLRRRYALR